MVCSCPNGLVTSNMAPAHPHATSVTVYTALLNCELFLHYCSCSTVRDWIAVYPALFHSQNNIFSENIFSRGHATLHLAVSVGTSVRRYVRHVFELRAVFALPLLPNSPRLDCRVSGLVLEPWDSWLQLFFMHNVETFIHSFSSSSNSDVLMTWHF